MYKRKSKRVDEEEERLKKEEARRKRQERFERCLKCRFFESNGDVSKKHCSNGQMQGRVCEEDVCPCFVRRWPEGINPVELLE